jgi:hypothetical protein
MATRKRLNSVAALLGDRLGGKWTYDNYATWWCDDGRRRVSRTHCGAYDHNGEPLDGPPHYWLYGDGEPRRAEEYMRREVKRMETHTIAPKGEQERT